MKRKKTTLREVEVLQIISSNVVTTPLLNYFHYRRKRKNIYKKKNFTRFGMVQDEQKNNENLYLSIYSTSNNQTYFINSFSLHQFANYKFPFLHSILPFFFCSTNFLKIQLISKHILLLCNKRRYFL